MKSEFTASNGVKYDFDTEAEYQGKKYVSIHKQSTFKEQVKHQNLTCTLGDWPAVKAWLQDCLGDRKEPGEDVPF